VAILANGELEVDETDEQHRVSWIPAHPSYGVLSMLRYWKSLEQAQQPDDRYQGHSVLGEAGDRSVEKQGKFKRIASRRFGYPRMISSHCQGELAHVFDHSWADMLPHVPNGTATVVTVHDLIPLRFPGNLTAAQLKRFRACVEHLKLADLIIAVSEYTRGEVCELLQIDAQRVHVVPNGVGATTLGTADPKWIEAQVRRADGALKIGSLGNTLERKNLSVFPAALQAYRDATGEIPVLIRAGQLLPGALRESITESLGDDHLVELGFVSDRQLEDFFAAIDVMVVPSFYEGFGLPVIEAMARGVPVIAADTSSLPEVGGNAALYFDPHDPEMLAAKLIEVAKPEKRNQLVEAGRMRAEIFTWRQSLEGCHRAYDTVLNR